MTEETKQKESEAEESRVKETGKAQECAPESTQGEGFGPETMPSPDFSSFIFSISTTVLMDLGEIEHPVDKEKKVNLVMAKHSIDVLDMLKEKTKGNLTESEGSLVDNIVADLKLRYCNKTA
jgi:hypothetical protein